MADKRITEMTTLSSVDPANDYVEIIDTSETDPTLKNKKTTPQSLMAAVKIDQLAEGTDVTTLDSNTTRHGLLKKLSGATTQFLSGIGSWVQVKDTDLSLQDEATMNATAARHGFLKKLSNIATEFLNGQGNYASVKDSDLSTSDVTNNNASTTKHGFLPKLSGIATEFLDGSGSYSTPATSGGGVTDHGALTGLADDDHTQYYNNARGDARYYTQGQVNSLVSGAISGVTKFDKAKYFPLYSAVPNVVTSFNNSNYDDFGFMSNNPVTGHVVVVYRKGSSHVGDKGNGYIRHSSNGGNTFGSESQFLTDATYDVRNLGGGYDKNGRLFVFYGLYNYSGSSWIGMRYIYSDNDGSSWSSPSTLSMQSNPVASPYGSIVDLGDGTLLQPWYAINDMTYNLYLYKSTDNGASFTTVLTIYSGAIAVTETSVVNMGGGNLLAVGRINSGTTFQQFVSTDNGANWTNQGATSFESWASGTNQQGMPYLFRFNYNGFNIVGLYFVRRDTSPQTLKIVYGLPSDLLSGVSGWNAATIKTIYNFSGTYKAGYQSALHNENFYGLIAAFDEISSNDADLVILPSPPQNLAGIISSLGL